MPEERFNLIVVDDLVLKVGTLIQLERLLFQHKELSERPQLIFSDYYDDSMIQVFKNLFKLQKKQIFTQMQLDFHSKVDNCISFSSEEDSVRTVCKFIKGKVEEERGIKFNFTKNP